MSGEWGNRVTGRCFACGRDGTLFVAFGGHITCSLDVCPNPTAVADFLDAVADLLLRPKADGAKR